MTPRKQKKLDDFHLKALDELFRRVGFEGYDKEFTNRNDWFTLRQWTLDESKDFANWFISEYSKDLGEPKYKAREQAGWFLLSYGWRYKE